MAVPVDGITKLLQAARGRCHVEVAFRVGRDVVAAAELLLHLHASHGFERLAVDDGDRLAAADIQELLLPVR